MVANRCKSGIVWKSAETLIFLSTNHKMELFDNQTKFELFAGFAAIGGVFALVLAISSVNSAALERYVERSNFRDCMIEKLESVCIASHPLGAIKWSVLLSFQI